MNFDPLNGDRQEMLKWLSQKNPHISTGDLAYLMDISRFDSDQEEDDIPALAWE